MEIGERRGAQTDKVRARVREREREREPRLFYTPFFRLFTRQEAEVRD